MYYISTMIRAFTSCLWIIAALALGVEAAAQPCQVRAQIEASTGHDMMADMACHDSMDMSMEHEMPTPDHAEMGCCCAALLGNGLANGPLNIAQPIPTLSTWAMPLPDDALSYLLEFDPPPPRA